jgi:hypothetical protein
MISYDRQYTWKGSYISPNNNKLNNISEFRKKFIINENYCLFQNYKDFNFIFNFI